MLEMLVGFSPQPFDTHFNQNDVDDTYFEEEKGDNALLEHFVTNYFGFWSSHAHETKIVAYEESKELKFISLADSNLNNNTWSSLQISELQIFQLQCWSV